MDNKDDFYEILQVHPSADPDIIQAAYRRLVFRYHPDRNTSPEAAGIMRRLNQAYEVLSDPQRRAAYDRSRAERSSSRPTGSAQKTHGSPSYSYGWQQWHESLRDSYLEPIR
jgi:curved DNA-binding protein CbpA